MDAEDRRRHLPALNWLDGDKVKSEDGTTRSQHNEGQHTSTTSTTSSPTYHHSSGPLPPPNHSYGRDTPQASHQVPTGWKASPTYDLSTEPRRRDVEEVGGKGQTRQSLPSISEALGVDSKSVLATIPPVPSVSATPVFPPVLTRPYAPGSPTLKRPYPMDPPFPPSRSPPHPAFPTFRPDHDSYSASVRSETASVSYRSEPASTHPRDSVVSFPPISTADHVGPGHDRPSVTHASIAPSPDHPPAYIPAHSVSHYATSVNSTATGLHRPPAHYAQPGESVGSWSTGNPRIMHAPLGHPPIHGETVKRHLEIYDLELALNDISDSSHILSDFARRYGDRMHQTQRQAPSVTMLPGVGEVEDMMHKAHFQQEALARIRDVVIQQQIAQEQQALHDQRKQQKAQADNAAAAAAAAAAASTINGPNGPMDHGSPDGEEGKAGNGEAKKRRGRAAPPGRCHSCHRAETPEWRRGPDGARTLCNACGLHYAKLTRKQQNAGAKAGAGLAGSTLRPKEATSN